MTIVRDVGFDDIIQQAFLEKIQYYSPTLVSGISVQTFLAQVCRWYCFLIKVTRGIG